MIRKLKSSFKLGDKVLLRQPRKDKLRTRFEDRDYTIVEKRGNAVKIRTSEGDEKVRN